MKLKKAKNKTTNKWWKIKNQVETINQYRVLQYLKKNLNIFSFQLFLYDKDSIKVIDCEDKQAYFKYNEDKKEVLFIEEELEVNL